MINRERISGIGLKFDGVTARSGGRFNELKRPVKRAVMVSRQLADDVGRLIRSDNAAVD